MRALEAAAENDAALIAVGEVLDVAGALGLEDAIAKGVAVGSRSTRTLTSANIDVDVFVDPGSLDRLGDLALALGASALDTMAIDAMVAEGRVSR